MKEDTFKMPYRWMDMISSFTDAEAGMAFKAVFRYAMYGEIKKPPTTSQRAAEVIDGCIEDIKFQRQHHRAYRVQDESRMIRNSAMYRDWRIAVYERDHYTCQICGQVGGHLNAHHIKHFAWYPESRLDVSNGITLCTRCHKLAHKRRHKDA